MEYVLEINKNQTNMMEIINKKLSMAHMFEKKQISSLTARVINKQISIILLLLFINK